MPYFNEYIKTLLENDENCVFINEDDIQNYDLSQMDERIIKQRVVRGGKRKFKFQTSKAGFKVLVNKEGVPKEVLIPPKERKAREISQKRAARLRKVKQDPAQEKRAASIKRSEIIHKTSSEKKQDELLKKKRDKEKEDKERQKRLTGGGGTKPSDTKRESFSGVYYGI
jgi:hypothetical protein